MRKRKEKEKNQSREFAFLIFDRKRIIAEKFRNEMILWLYEKMVLIF